MIRQFGGTPVGVWIIKHVIAPLDRWMYRRTGGQRVALGKPLAPMLLLTTRGRKSGKARTTPVFYLRDGERLILCNVNPGFEKPNPWPLNLRANPTALVEVGTDQGMYTAREATTEEIERYWPRLVAMWPAYQTHFDRSGQRTIFVLTSQPT